MAESKPSRKAQIRDAIALLVSGGYCRPGRLDSAIAAARSTRSGKRQAIAERVGVDEALFSAALDLVRRWPRPDSLVRNPTEDPAADLRWLRRRLVDRGLVEAAVFEQVVHESASSDGSGGMADLLRRLLVEDAIDGSTLATVIRERASDPGQALRRLGRYELHELIGRGGMGVVYEAEDPELERRVALKVLRLDAGEHAAERLRREAKLTASLNHPGIIQIHEVGEAFDAEADSAVNYIAMDLVSGGTLTDPLQDLELEPKIELVRQVAEAIGHAHEAGIIHRDLKPENVLIDDRGQAVVTDFGLARAVDQVTMLTQTGAAVGTPTHMSPEQVDGDDDVGPPADVWAIGVLLYEALTGSLPFWGSTRARLTYAIVHRRPRLPRRRDPSIPADLEAVCMKCLARDPLRRYETAAEVAAELARWQRGAPTRTRPPGVVGQLMATAQQNARALAIAGAALAAVVALLTTQLLLASRARAVRLQRLSAAAAELAPEPLFAESQALVEAHGEGTLPLSARLRAERLIDRLRAVTAAEERVLELAPEQQDSRRRAQRALLLMAHLAERAENGPVARMALGAAGRLGVADAELAAISERIDAGRQQRLTLRRARVEALLAQSKQGQLDERSLVDGVVELAAMRDAQTVRQLLDALRLAVEAVRARTRAELLAHAEPSEEELAQGWEPLAGAEPAVDRWLRTRQLNERHRELVETLCERIELRTMRGLRTTRRTPWRVLLAERQAEALAAEAGGAQQLRLVCDALGRLGPEQAVELLASYLWIDRSVERVTAPARALARLTHLHPAADAEIRALTGGGRYDYNGTVWREMRPLMKTDDTVRVGGSAEEQLTQAEELLARGRVERALAIFEAAARRQPESVRALSGLALALLHLERLEPAEVALDQALALAPESPAVLQNLAALRMHQGRQTDALPLAERAIAAGASSPPVHMVRGAALMSMRRYREALAAFGDALAVDGSHVGARRSRANCLMRLKQLPAALIECNSALRIAPDDVATLVTRSDLHRRLGMIEEAIADGARAARLAPSNSRAHFMHARALAEGGRQREAEAAYTASIEHDSSQASAYMNRGILRVHFNDLDGAERDYSRAIAHGGDSDVKTWLNRARLRRRRGNLAGALEDENEAIRRFPQDPSTFLSRAETQMERKEWSEALHDARSARRAGADERAALMIEALVHHRRGMLARAIELYEAIRKRGVTREYELVYLRLASARMLTREFEAGITVCTAGLQFNPELVPLRAIRGQANLILERIPQALADAEHAIKQAPAYANGWKLRGMVRYREGKFAEAVTDFQQVVELGRADWSLYRRLADAHFRAGAPAAARAAIDKAIEKAPASERAGLQRRRQAYGN